ncbi:excinuclease ABC subunit UvrC [Apilactobacillus xinyiensis]|uniref:excinuclease ABC subunit UvrC n=1 Tax=Apilactobacillus xinyiensis TaxID=2841032 RepID=UPI00200D9E08|nr:excinuclease ABC subunit UvrC [Apilactobacillus xinyiensis]MCL0329939.1 excinuclease ABC subunit UvrC [Apilactobacillus xinyiensis]
MATPHIERKLKLLPDLPGCYLMKNEQGKIIYVGKAKNLKNRVRSYFKSSHTGKTAKLVSQIRDFETIITSNDKEAFLLEITLIHKHRPHYNIQLKQGNGGYPYIKITNEHDPRLMIVNNVKNDGGYYFGPYPNVYAADETLHFLQKTYPLRRCNGYQKRPCLYYHMGQCLGACFKEVPQSLYQKQIRKIKSFLNGNVNSAKKEITSKMMEASNNLEFERAAELRDQLKYIEITVEKQKIITNDNTTRDIFNYYTDMGWISIQIFFIRQARLMKRVKRAFPIVNNPDEEFLSFIVQFYKQKNQPVPKEILVPDSFDRDVLASILNTSIKTPKRGQKLELLKMVKKNSKLVLEEKFRLMEFGKRKTLGAVEDLSRKLNIPTAHRIESFDHSHIQGTDIVSAMVVFEDGLPNKNMYRKYKLKTVDKADESASTHEVIRRRYSRLLKEHKSLPDLILMDGGEIQLAAVKDVLVNEFNLNIPVAGMVKDNKHKTSHLIINDNQYIPIKHDSQAFYLVERIQDEVHRFAINFHRQVHTKHSLSSELDSIKGVGPKTKIKLLNKFGSLDKISDADVKELREIGISQDVAKNIKLTLDILNRKRKSKK